jgi:hypothetical protein
MRPVYQVYQFNQRISQKPHSRMEMLHCFISLGVRKGIIEDLGDYGNVSSASVSVEHTHYSPLFSE